MQLNDQQQRDPILCNVCENLGHDCHVCDGESQFNKDDEMQNDKPLFIPLKREYYEQFESGEKTYEIRKHGKRWHSGTCWVGRKATVSLGYGKSNRLNMVVSKVEIKQVCDLSDRDQDACIDCGMVGEVILIHLEKDNA